MSPNELSIQKPKLEDGQITGLRVEVKVDV